MVREQFMPDDMDDIKIDDPIILLNTWYRRLRESQFAHYETAKRRAREHTWVGVGVMVLSVGSGATALAYLAAPVGPPLYFALSASSGLATVLAAIQTFLRIDQRAEIHRRSGARYGALRRQIEQALALETDQLRRQPQIVEAIRQGIDEASESAPNVPPRIYQRVVLQLKSNPLGDYANPPR
jgi:hypothetical protein